MKTETAKNYRLILWDKMTDMRGIVVTKETVQNLNIKNMLVVFKSKDIFCHLSSLLVNVGCLQFSSSITAATLLMELVAIQNWPPGSLPLGLQNLMEMIF